jgi:hypothetical protein
MTLSQNVICTVKSVYENIKDKKWSWGLSTETFLVSQSWFNKFKQYV